MTVLELTTTGENADLLRELAAKDIPFIIVGGLAVAFYRCRNPDDVDDLDLMIRPEERNMCGFISALEALGLRGPWSAHDLSKPSVHLPIKDTLYMDVLTPPSDFTFDELLEASIPALLNGVQARVIGRDHLIVLKRKAVESARGTLTKHSADLRCLEAGRGF